MKPSAYYRDADISDIEFPDIGEREVCQGKRNMILIPNHKAIVDKNTNYCYAIVKDGYKIIQHKEVIERIDDICTQFPEYGTPVREIWMSNYGGRMKTRWTFKGIDFAIGKLADGTPDTVHPTLETFSSCDTSLAQWTTVGGWRKICSNGLTVGKTLGSYKRKHTLNLDLDKAKRVLVNGMENYSKAQNLWLSYTERDAFMKEVNAYESIGFQKLEKLSIEREIKRKGKIIKWENEKPEDRIVEINAWELLNIYTAEASHRITDVTRQQKVQDNIAKTFAN